MVSWNLDNFELILEKQLTGLDILKSIVLSSIGFRG